MKSDAPILNPAPARVYPPGTNIRHILEDMNMSQTQFAALIERPKQFVSELLSGKRQITIDTARRLEAALGASAAFWLRLEANYRLHVEKTDAEVLDRIRERVEQAESKAGKTAYAG